MANLDILQQKNVKPVFARFEYPTSWLLREYSIVVRVSPMIDTQIVSSCKDKSWWLLAHCRALSLLPLTHVYLFILVQFLVVLLD